MERDSAIINRSRSRSRAAAQSLLGTSDDNHAQALLFQAASRGNRVAVQRALVNGADPVSAALERCKCQLAEEACVCLGYAPVHCAVQAGSTSTVRALLDAQADPCALSGRILFAVGRRSGSSGSSSGSHDPAPMIVVDGITPLHVAAACGHRPIAELLLRRFADPHTAAVEPEKSTALRFACLTHQNELADFLRRAMLERVMQRVEESSSRPETFIMRQSPSLMGGEPMQAESQPALSTRMQGLRLRVRAREEHQRLLEQQRQQQESQEDTLPSEIEAERSAALRDGRGAGGVAANGGA